MELCWAQHARWELRQGQDSQVDEGWESEVLGAGGGVVGEVSIWDAPSHMRAGCVLAAHFPPGKAQGRRTDMEFQAPSFSVVHPQLYRPSGE